jgi:uncharacterized protein
MLINHAFVIILGVISPLVHAASVQGRHDEDGGRTKDALLSKRTAQEVINQLQLVPNLEKGFYVQTFQDQDTTHSRSLSTAIYYLLEGSAGDSYWHRVDAVEIWHYYAGAPLTLSLSRNDSTPTRKCILGPDIFNGQQPQIAIPKWEWQRARSMGDWTLVGTTGEVTHYT